MSALTLCDMNGMSSEPGSLPDQRSWLRQKAWNFTTHQLIASWLLAKGMKLVHVAHVPCTDSGAVIVCYGIPSSSQLRSFGVEGISVFVVWATNRFV